MANWAARKMRLCLDCAAKTRRCGQQDSAARDQRQTFNRVWQRYSVLVAFDPGRGRLRRILCLRRCREARLIQSPEGSRNPPTACVFVVVDEGRNALIAGFMTETKNIIAFDGTEIDPDRGELRRDGNPVAVEPQVFDLVRFLAERPGRVVSRDELIEGVWHGRIVSDSAIASRISAAREAVGDNGTDQRVIKTVARRGFLFLPVPKTEMPAADTPRQIDAVRGDRPTIAVLPFRNLSGDPAQSYFSEGIAEDILTNLARFEEMIVLARQSAFAFDPLADNAMQFSRKLGVDYGLEGSVQRSQTRVRVTARLFDAASGEALWADRFDRVPDDIFAIQDEISGAIVNALVGEVSEHRYVRLQAQAPRKLGAYDHALRAQQMLWNVSREALTHRAPRPDRRSILNRISRARMPCCPGQN